MKRYFLIAAGGVSFALGAAGVFIPLLPTTPFMLLSAACFFRSSDRLYRGVLHHRIFGKYISNYIRHRAVSGGTRIVSLLLLWTTILSSAVFFTENAWVRVLLLVVAAGVSIHLLALRTLGKETTGEPKGEKR